MTPKRLLPALIVILAIGTLVIVARRSSSSVPRPPHVPQPETPGLALSPQKDKGVLVSTQQAEPEVWLVSPAENKRQLVRRFVRGEGARNVSWSPDGQLFAFESYNVEGHSPMTTTRVWVVDSKDLSVREVRLPSPNERFSTYLDRWVQPGTLRLRATLLDRSNDVFYLYHHDTGQLEGPTK